MNNFKLEYVNPGYGFRNYKIGEITVYTVRLKFTFNYYNEILFKSLNYNGNVVRTDRKDNSLYISYDTINWEIMLRMRKEIWDICRRIAQEKLDRKYSQLKLNL